MCLALYWIGSAGRDKNSLYLREHYVLFAKKEKKIDNHRALLAEQPAMVDTQ